jgi:hypothetical protein
LLQPRTALLPAAGDVSVDVLEDLQHMNKNICYNLFVILLHLRNMFATWSPASLAFLFCFLNEPFFASVICCRGDFFAAGGVFLLHANLTVKMVDPTAGDPGAGESDPPGDAQQFPFLIKAHANNRGHSISTIIRRISFFSKKII